ncbi:MAG: hypothetical protein J0M04_10040 [Verrucomicrobia bacterium]|nr:hypothetical protein [Verrucomicrobiota bacterium]
MLYWLEMARLAGGDPRVVIDTAQAKAGYAGTKMAAADKAAMLWDRKKLDEFGCLNAEGMAKLRKGGSPTITMGPNVGDTVALDHVLPIAVVPELAARFYNLEVVPDDANRKKSAKIGKREVDLAKRWNREGLLSGAGLRATEAAE